MKWEGFRSQAYQCPAFIWTIGYGHTGGVKPGDEVTQDMAVRQFEKDLTLYENYVRFIFDDVELTQRQFEAAVSFCYNAGPGNCWKADWVVFLKAGNVSAAAVSLGKWGQKQWKTAPGLRERRKFESLLLTAKDGEWVSIDKSGKMTIEEVPNA